MPRATSSFMARNAAMSHGYRQAGGRLEGYLSFAHANAPPPAPRREQHPGGRGGRAAPPSRCVRGLAAPLPITRSRPRGPPGAGASMPPWQPLALKEAGPTSYRDGPALRRPGAALDWKRAKKRPRPLIFPDEPLSPPGGPSGTAPGFGRPRERASPASANRGQPPTRLAQGGPNPRAAGWRSAAAADCVRGQRIRCGLPES